MRAILIATLFCEWLGANRGWAEPFGPTVWHPIFQGVEMTQVTHQQPDGSRQAIYAIRINLRHPGISFDTTPGNGNRLAEVESQTASEYVRSSGVQIAINANFFSPCCNGISEPKDLEGLAVRSGELVSPAKAGYASLVIDREKRAALVEAQRPGLGVSTAISGNWVLLRSGVRVNPRDDNRQPRSLIGLNQQQGHLILAVIDGRQPGYSDGATMDEATACLVHLGASEGLNLDGGGSTALVLHEADGIRLLNKPSGGRERFNGNHLGVFAAPLSPKP